MLTDIEHAQANRFGETNAKLTFIEDSALTQLPKPFREGPATLSG